MIGFVDKLDEERAALFSHITQCMDAVKRGNIFEARFGATINHEGADGESEIKEEVLGYLIGMEETVSTWHSEGICEILNYEVEPVRFKAGSLLKGRVSAFQSFANTDEDGQHGSIFYTEDTVFHPDEILESLDRRRTLIESLYYEIVGDPQGVVLSVKESHYRSDSLTTPQAGLLLNTLQGLSKFHRIFSGDPEVQVEDNEPYPISVAYARMSRLGPVIQEHDFPDDHFPVKLRTESDHRVITLDEHFAEALVLKKEGLSLAKSR